MSLSLGLLKAMQDTGLLRQLGGGNLYLLVQGDEFWEVSTLNKLITFKMEAGHSPEMSERTY
jgi:hypothetical protein